MHSTKVSFKHLKLHTQFKFIVKNEFVATYGIVADVVVSGLSANTLNVAQQPSIFSILNTFEHTTPSSPHVTFSLVVHLDIIHFFHPLSYSFHHQVFFQSQPSEPNCQSYSPNEKSAKSQGNFL